MLLGLFAFQHPATPHIHLPCSMSPASPSFFAGGLAQHGVPLVKRSLLHPGLHPLPAVLTPKMCGAEQLPQPPPSVGQTSLLSAASGCPSLADCSCNPLLDTGKAPGAQKVLADSPLPLQA